MDAAPLSLRRLTALSLLLPAVLAGCHHSSGNKRSVRRAVKRELGLDKEKDSGSTVVVRGDQNHFTVNDEEGKPLLDAHTEGINGAVHSGAGLDGPVTMKNVKALLYQKGEPSMDIDTPEAIWDGNQLTTDKSAHGVTRDKKTIVDGQKVVWTAKGGKMDLHQAKVQSLKDGKVNFSAEGPHAIVLDQVTTMDSGAHGYNPDGQQLTSDHLRWFMKTNQLEADGNVVVIDPGTRISGDKLRGDTKLQKGRFTGRTRVVTNSVGKKGGPQVAARGGKRR